MGVLIQDKWRGTPWPRQVVPPYIRRTGGAVLSVCLLRSCRRTFLCSFVWLQFMRESRHFILHGHQTYLLWPRFHRSLRNKNSSQCICLTVFQFSSDYLTLMVFTDLWCPLLYFSVETTPARWYYISVNHISGSWLGDSINQSGNRI